MNMNLRKFGSALRLGVVGAFLGGATLLGTGQAHAQASFTGSYTQDFNTLGTTATATLPTGFKVDKVTTGARTVGTYAAAGTATERVGGSGLSATAGNGIYNFGSGTTATGDATDRAVGFLSSSTATQSGNLYVALTNNTSAAINTISITYDVEKYRLGTNAAGFRIAAFYSPSDASGSYVSTGISGGFAGADATNNGYATVPGAVVNATGTYTPATPIAVGATFYLALNYSVTSGTTTSNAQALAVDNFAVATAATPLKISQFRLGGPNGPTDEFIELYNTSSGSVSTTGYVLTAGTTTTALTGPDLTGKTIPGFGHLLITNSGGYSLGVSGDVTYTGDIATNSTLTLSNGSTTLDAVGNLSGTAAPTSATSQYAYVRRLEGGPALDTDVDSNDFNLVDINSTTDTAGANGVATLGTTARLGAPGPHNIASPIQRNSLVTLRPSTDITSDSTLR